MSQAVLSADGRSDVSAADSRVQLGRILGSTDFDATDRERRFLGHVVEETLSGRGDRIKAYSIAVEVFGRDVSFDPQSDPIVRIEAGHLRRALERYYLTAGVGDPILITIPKGGYVPSFATRPQLVPVAQPASPVDAPPKSTTPARPTRYPFLAMAALLAVLAAGAFAWFWTSSSVVPNVPDSPALLVTPFDDLSGTEASAAITRGLSQEIVGQLSKFRDLVVLESADSRTDDTARPRFELAGSVNLSPDAFRLRVRLINRSDGSVLWANSYDGAMDVSELVGAQSDIARNVATTLAQTYGVIFQADASARMENPPDDWAAYSCTLSYYAYRAEADPNALESVRICLEQAVERFPSYATAWGLLSQAYIDSMRYRYPHDSTSEKEIDLALAAAKRAVELDPFNVRGLQAEMFALYFSGDIEAALAVGKRAMAINPNDTELIGEYGFRLALSGNWTEGCPLVAQARERNPGPLAYYDTALAQCAYFGGNYARAATLIKRASVANNPSYHALAAAMFAEAGLAAEAAREREWLEANVPAFIKNARQELSIRYARTEDVEFFLGSLKKAGLDIAD